ncbi:MAG: AAA family ATPase [Longimicrobiales bacterium]|nr:AAA family ATPase [Longimicrobiales bacterium]
MHVVRTLGGLSIEGREGTLTGAAGQRHRLALLALLARAQPESVARETLVRLLWPQRESRSARNLLSQGLHALRSALGPECLPADRRSVRLDEERLPADVLLFDRAVHAGDLRRAAGLYRGAFLEGISPPPTGEFVRWVEENRRQLDRSYLGVLEALADRAEREARPADAVLWWLRRWDEEPLSTRVTLRLMRALARSGDRAEAIRYAEAHASRLEAELGATPAPDLMALAQEMRHGSGGVGKARPWKSTSSPATPKAEFGSTRPSIEFPLLGRSEEWGTLVGSWRQGAGSPHMLVISGVPGIGKTRLAEELLIRGHREGMTCVRSRCYALEGRLAYAPVAECVRSDAVRAGLRHLEAVWRHEVARIAPELAISEREPEPGGPLTEEWQRRRLFEALARAILSAPQPIVWLIDDLQWCDSDTLQWLRFLMRFDTDADLAIVATVRDDEIEPANPWNRLVLELRKTGQIDELAVGPLDRTATAALAGQVIQEDLSMELGNRVFAETEGNPLLVVEVARAGALDGRSGLPPRAQAVLELRLSRLSPEARATSEMATVIARPFDLELGYAASELSKAELPEALDELARRRIVGCAEGSTSDFAFTHDKLREAVDAGIGPARRATLNRRVGEALESLFSSNPESVASRLATHFEAAGLTNRAVHFYEAAAGVARATFANEEAFALLGRALSLVAGCPPGPDRDRLEYRLQVARGVSAAAARGWAAEAAGESFERALSLGRSLDDRSAALLTAGWGRCAFLAVRARFRRALEEPDFVWSASRSLESDSAEAVSAFNIAMNLFHLGELDRALELLRLVPETSGSPQHAFSFSISLLDVLSRTYRAHTSWLAGDSEDALASIAQATKLAEQRDDTFAHGIARCYEALLHQLRGDAESVRDAAAAAWELCDANAIPYYRAWASILHGWARGALEDPLTGLAEAERGLAAMLATGARLRKPSYLGLIGDLHARAGEPKRGLEVVREALALAAQTEEVWCLPGLKSLKARLQSE